MTQPHGAHGHGAGPHHGPAHPGDRSSAEPGGFDEFDHAPVTRPDDTVHDGINTERVNDATGIPVVSDGTAGEGDGMEFVPGPEATFGSQGSADAVLAAERLEDLRRLQAEYVNYKRRVDRDRSLARDQGISHVLEAMLPVLDEIHLAREHGDLGEGAPAAIVDKLEAVLARLGIERFGSEGDEFDPNHHEALMRIEADLPEGATTTTVVKVLQPGYRLGDRVVRAARVAVADPA